MLAAGGLDVVGQSAGIGSARVELLGGPNSANTSDESLSGRAPRLNEADRQALWDRFSEQVRQSFADQVTSADPGNDGAHLTPEKLFSQESARQRDLEYAYQEFITQQPQFDGLADEFSGAQGAIENGRISAAKRTAVRVPGLPRGV